MTLACHNQLWLVFPASFLTSITGGNKLSNHWKFFKYYFVRISSFTICTSPDINLFDGVEEKGKKKRTTKAKHTKIECILFCMQRNDIMCVFLDPLSGSWQWRWMS